jgi:ribonuclease HI
VRPTRRDAIHKPHSFEKQLIAMVQQPQFLLICDSNISTPAIIDGINQPSIGVGRWRFLLESLDGTQRLEATDSESYIHQHRLALLAVVRGLEALEQSSVVRLLTSSRYVDRGLRFGLQNWRDTNYYWESFGVQKPIRNADLWQRVDVAMQYHDVTCRLLKGQGMAEAILEAHYEQPAALDRDWAEATAGPQAIWQSSAAVLADRNSAGSARPGVKRALTELVARFKPKQVIYRVEDAASRRGPASTTPHRFTAVGNVLGPRRPHFLQANRSPAADSQLGSTPVRRLQWWEMATNWERPITAELAPVRDNCAARSATG